MDAFNPITTALILGATAALQKTAGQIVEAAYHSRSAARLPQEAVGCADDLIDECVRLLAQTADLPDLKAHLVQRLAATPSTLLILLDGLDEVADEQTRNRLLDAVRHFSQRFRQTLTKSSGARRSCWRWGISAGCYVNTKMRSPSSSTSFPKRRNGRLTGGGYSYWAKPMCGC